MFNLVLPTAYLVFYSILRLSAESSTMRCKIWEPKRVRGLADVAHFLYKPFPVAVLFMHQVPTHVRLVGDACGFVPIEVLHARQTCLVLNSSLSFFNSA